MFTGRIHDQLKASFGANNVFRDMYNIPAGSDFRSVINEAVGSTDICLVIIGLQWLNVKDAQGKRRLDDPNDFVRIEVESALKNPRTRVIPVLVDNAVMPVADELPDSLAELAYRNAVRVRTDPDFPHDMEILTRQLEHPTRQRVMRSLWLILPLLFLLIPGFYLFTAQKGKETGIPTATLAATVTVLPSETATVIPSTSTPLVEPIAPGEVMVLVAQMEQIGKQQRDVTRFIVEDLAQRFETDPLVTNVRVREYGDTIKSNLLAWDVAQRTGAVIVIWGQYDDDGTTVNVQLGSLESLQDPVIDRATLERTINVRLRMKDERQETLAHAVLSSLTFLANAENDFVENCRLIMALDQLDAPKPEIIGNSIAAHTHRAAQVFLSDPETALSEVSLGIDMDAANPWLYTFRALVYQELGNFPLGRQDSDTAIRLAPKDWVIPYYVRGDENLITNDVPGGIEAYTRVIAIRPDDWYPYNMRGYFYFLAHKY